MSNKHTQANKRCNGRAIAILVAAALNLLVSGCNSDNDRVVTPTCDAGTEGCACLTGDVQCRGDGLFCAGGICRKESCTPGSLDCACYPNMSCDKKADGTWLVCDRGLCAEPSCRQGEAGCGCYPNGTCNKDLKCSEANGTLLCVSPDCVVGTAGCNCGPNYTCSPTDAGTQLACINNVCMNFNPSASTNTNTTTGTGTNTNTGTGTATSTTCTPGDPNCGCKPDSTCNPGFICGAAGRCITNPCTSDKIGTLGCACKSNGTCSSSGLACSADGVCVTATGGCTLGTENCGCKSDLTCMGNASDGSKLTCNLGLCVRSTCQVGDLNCPCTTASKCNDSASSCVSGMCVTATCPEGTLGCACGAGQTCNTTQSGTALTCVANTCTDCVNQSCVTAGLTFPKTPVCYTPCLQGYKEDAGPYHDCPPDGLMPHPAGGACLDSKVCKQGSCVETGDTVPTCQSDVECPDFQNCVQDTCYAVCDNDLDCPKDLACYRHACRRPCSSSDQTCTDHTA